MPAAVKLTDLVDALDIQNDEIFSFLDTQTGQVVMVSREEMRAVETGTKIDTYPDWQQELMKEAQAVVEDETGRYLELPTQFEVNEYAIMEKFCLSVTALLFNGRTRGGIAKAFISPGAIPPQD